MAQRQVVEVECARCDRKEYREPKSDPGPTVSGPTPAFSASLFVGEAMKISFEDLCTPCANTIKGHLQQIAKKIEGNSPVREKRSGKQILDQVVERVNGTGAKEKGHATRA